MINDKDSHIPSPVIMFTCTALRHALLEWQKYKGVHPKASKSKLKADRPDRSNYFNHKNDASKIASSCAETGCKLSTSPGVADTCMFLMNTWNTLPESYQQRVYNNTLATVKRQIQQAENPMPAMVISVEAARVDNAILLHHLASEVPLEEHEIRRTAPNIPIDNNCTDDVLYFGMPGGRVDYEDEGEKSDDRDAIPTPSRRQWPTTELERFDLGTSDVNGYEGDDGDGYDGEDGDDTDADDEEVALQADDGSTQNVEDWWHSTRECEDWTVYFRPVKYNNGEANATASEVSEAKTVLQYVTKSQSKTCMGRVRHPIYTNSIEVICGYRPKIHINIARRLANGYSITASPAKSETHVSFWWSLYQAQSNGGQWETRPIAWATGSVLFSISRYEVPAELSELSGTPGCFRRTLGSLLMYHFFQQYLGQPWSVNRWMAGDEVSHFRKSIHYYRNSIEPLLLGYPTTKSIDISSHGWFSMGKGRMIPNVECLERRDCWQLSQFGMYRLPAFRIPLQWYFQSGSSNDFARPGWPTHPLSRSSWIISWRRVSLSGMYRFSLYRICPSSSVHSATVISWSPLFVRIGSANFPGRGSITYASAITSEIEGRRWMGRLSANKHKSFGRFSGFRTTCSIFFNLSSPPSGRSPGLRVKASSFPFNFPALYTIW